MRDVVERRSGNGRDLGDVWCRELGWWEQTSPLFSSLSLSFSWES